MDGAGEGAGSPAHAPAGEALSSVQVCVRVRPINERERGEGHRVCVSFDDPTKQVVLTAVDKNTLLQLRGATAKGYAFDKRYPPESTSDDIYNDCVAHLVENCFKGYNATVLAYGQTGSGKTHTMSGGVGIHGRREEGVTPRVIRHLFAVVDELNARAKPGEKVEVMASALELYNEDLLDLSLRSTREEAANRSNWDVRASTGLKLQERPVGRDGRVVPEVVGLREIKARTGEELSRFYAECMENRAVSSTKLNDASSRSHAIFTITIVRTMVEVVGEDGGPGAAKVRTVEFSSKLHLVDLAGSERVKRSGVTGKELKEATHINSGLLALGNVIVALSNETDNKKKGHVPYRDSKLTRLLQDSLGGNSLTVLISCVSPSEMDFEETNNTLKYANRACSIKNTPLPTRFTALEEDLLPSLPVGGGLGLAQIQALLEDHERLKEVRERRERERREKEAKRAANLAALKDEQAKKPGYQRLRASQYDELRRQLAARGATNIPSGQVIGDESLASFGRHRVGQLDMAAASAAAAASNGPPSSGRTPRSARGNASFARPRGSGAGAFVRTVSTSGSAPRSAGQSYQDWLATQQAEGEEEPGAEYDQATEELGSDFIVDDDDKADAAHEGTTESFLVDDDADTPGSAQAAGVDPSQGKSKFRRARGPVADLKGEEEELRNTSEAGTNTDPYGDVEQEEELPYDPISDVATPKLLARFKINTTDVLSVFKAMSKEDFQDVISLLPANTPLPASDKMTYLLARLECGQAGDLDSRLTRVAAGEASMNEAVGPAVGCLMATFGTNMISSCIFDFPDPDELKFYDVEERIELWGLQIPHNSVRPQLDPDAALAQVEGEAGAAAPTTITWTSVDRLNMSIGLLYALCNNASDSGVRCGFCVPRPQLLKRWLQAGVRMRQIKDNLQLIYPTSAHDYEYYKASTVAYFMIEEVREALSKVLPVVQ